MTVAAPTPALPGARLQRLVSVGLVEDHPVFRRGLARAIAAHAGLELAFAAPDGRSGLRALRIAAPDVALVDVRMPGMSGLEVCERLACEPVRTRLLLITSSPDPALQVRAARAGAAGLLSKALSRREICAALLSAAGER
jgi:two-component system nitrate/nitrite response regulator NarL